MEKESISVKIEQFDFNEKCEEKLKNKKYENWPVVYIIHGKSKKEMMYVGETTNTIRRMKDHLKNEEKKKLKCLKTILSNQYNKSVILDLESTLIQLMMAEGYTLLNRNDGQQIHNYYDAKRYEESFRDVWNKLKKEKIVKGDYDELKNSELFKLSPYKNLSSKQLEIENNIIEQTISILKELDNQTIVVEGGPGTGKSLMLLHMVKKMIDLQEVLESDKYFEKNVNEDYDSLYKSMQKLIKVKGSKLHIGIVIPMCRFRKTVNNIVKKTAKLKNNVSVISPYTLVYSDKEYLEKKVENIIKDDDVNKYDILIVDEGHRLSKKNRKPRQKYDKAFEEGFNQFDWIKKCSKIQIVFYDRNQIIGPIDNENLEKIVDKIKKEDKYYYKLLSQFRCLGGDDYIEYIDNVLQNKTIKKRNFDKGENKYEFYIFNDPDFMIKEIKKKDNPHKNIKARNLSGISWENSKDSKKTVLNKYNWNNMKRNDWVNSKDAINEIGCIHTIQGYDINYAGVIIGKELKYNEKDGIYVDINEYKDRKGKFGIDDVNELKRYIINIYKVLLTRGINGTYVYACDEGLREYLKKYISTYNE